MGISVVQSVKAVGQSVNSVTTAAISTTNGNLINIFYTWYTGTAEPTLSDTQSLTFTSVQTNAGTAWGVREKYSNSITGNASHTFTTSVTGGYMTVVAREVTGQATSTVLDQSLIVATSDNTTSHTTGNTGTTSQANELLLGNGCQTGFSSIVYSVSAPWTQDQEYDATGQRSGTMSASRVVSSAAAYSYDFTSDLTSDAIRLISTWKEAAAAAGLTPRSLIVKQAVNRASTY